MDVGRLLEVEDEAVPEIDAVARLHGEESVLDLVEGTDELDALLGGHDLDVGIGGLELGEPARVVGLELSLPMLGRARKKAPSQCFQAVRGDMRWLPFADGAFDKAVSVTAIEFLEEARSAVAELFRVTRPGGLVVVASLNSLSRWATRGSGAMSAQRSLDAASG